MSRLSLLTVVFLLSTSGANSQPTVPADEGSLFVAPGSIQELKLPPGGLPTDVVISREDIAQVRFDPRIRGGY